jgi:hypothetical protein
VLTAYESQRRLRRNYLEGARKRRLTYTPAGLWQAWKDLDAASKVYCGTIAGFVITVSHLQTVTDINADKHSSSPPSCYSSARADSTEPMVSSVKQQITTCVEEASNGMTLTLLVPHFTNSTQDSLHLRAAILDSHYWPMDSLEDPTYQGRPFLGMANQAGNHRGVSVTLHPILAYSYRPQFTWYTPVDRIYFFESRRSRSYKQLFCPSWMVSSSC